jgi:hypothetical protein
MSKQDRQGVRRPADVERKWNFKRRFDNAMEATAEVSEEVKQLDRAMDQTEIFNRLTNYGKAQGLFMDEEGNVFINASFLTTGILKSLDGTTFYLDLVKGILRGQFEEFSISGKTVEEIATESSGKAQTNAEKYADKAAKNAVESQTQTDVFNKLTNNGKSEGIYYKNGQLFINASYLAAGILKTLDGTTFNLDISKNVLKILGKTVSWEKQDDGTFHLVGK